MLILNMFYIYTFMRTIIRPFFLGNTLKYLPKPIENSWNPRKNWTKSSTSDEISFIDEYKTRASNMLQNCYNLLTSKEWKVETITTDGDEVSYMQLPSEWKLDGKVMKITGIIDVPASILIDLLFDGIEEFPLWNKLVTESIKLQNIDENMDIVYQVTSSYGGGLITARDFVILRHRKKCGDYYINSGISVPTALVQIRPNITRGENGISCFATEELSDEEAKCRFTWILNTNLKGWIPQTVVDRAISTSLIDFITYLRKHLDDMQKPLV